MNPLFLAPTENVFKICANSFFSFGSLGFFAFTSSSNSFFATFVDLFVFLTPCRHYFFDVLLGQRSKPGSHVFASSPTASDTKRELDMITLRKSWSAVIHDIITRDLECS